MRARHDDAARAATSSVCLGPVLSSLNDDVYRARRYNRFRQVQPPAQPGSRRLFLHLRDLVYLHPEAASASAVSCVRTIEARVVAAKAARETGLAEARARGLRR
jgi:hypothetical protein